ncbi:MAG: signal recognition particle protein [Planctomycetota bacterium]
MFESIAKALDGVFKSFRKQGKLTEANIKEGMRQIRMALLEADVSYKVAKDFVAACTEKAIGEEIIKSIQPAQQIVKIVHDELVLLMGEADTSLPPAKGGGPGVIMMLGLQGSGKTTTCGKLAGLAAKKGRTPLLVAADVQRPAAVKQLQLLGKQLDVPVFTEEFSPQQICAMGVKHARAENLDLVIIDTAGRLHIDEPLMEELKKIDAKTKPGQKLLVANAMTGQDAVNSADEFNKQLGIDGVILTMLDGDARGGAALSIRAVTGRPIKFVGVGEKLDAIEEFHPDRMAGRILNMGDIVGLVEKAQEVMDAEKAEKLQKKLQKATFTLDDMLEQFQQLKRMGPLTDLLSKIPGMGAMIGDEGIDESQFTQVEAIIQSMTSDERQHPEIIDGRRRLRISSGSGTSVQDVNSLLKEFKQMKKMIKQGMRGRKGGFPGFGFSG